MSAPVDVVTAFLCDGRRVLLALRSGKVSTFPGHWAGISGYLEGDDPLTWAAVEACEECGVERSRLTLWNAGRPLIAKDVASGRAFRVHSFLFHLDQPESLRMDWEARRFEWIDVDEFRRGQRQPTVPRLLDSFERVWPPWSTERAFRKNLAWSLRWLRDDRQMGAGTLARAAATELKKLVKLSADWPPAEARKQLKGAIRKLRRVRASMAPPANLLSDIAADLDVCEFADQRLAAIERRITRSEKAEEAVAQLAAERLPRGARVMTISFSQTVLRTLIAAAPRVARVCVCEGRPLMEGRRLAEVLHKAGIKVTLVTDAQAFLLAPQIDLVLLGADALTPSGGAVNKVGSTLLALAAREFGKRVVVVAETLKRVRDVAAYQAPCENNPAKEVWDSPPQGVDVANFYFEEMPARLIDAIWTEETGHSESERLTLRSN